MFHFATKWLTQIVHFLKKNVKKVQFDTNESFESRIEFAKKNVRKKGTHNDLQHLNDVLYNAGFSFRVEYLSKNQVLIQGSFDFSYYVQLEINFYDVLFTNVKTDQYWSDAWYGNQLELLSDKKNRSRLECIFQINLQKDDLVFQFRSLSFTNQDDLTIVAKSMTYTFIS